MSAVHIPQGVLPDINGRHMLVQVVGNQEFFIGVDPVRITDVWVEFDDLFDPVPHFVALGTFPRGDDTRDGVADHDIHDLSHLLGSFRFELSRRFSCGCSSGKFYRHVRRGRWSWRTAIFMGMHTEGR